MVCNLDPGLNLAISCTFSLLHTAPTVHITVNVVPSSVATPVVGSMYSLICTITGAERLTEHDAVVNYQWLKNDALVSRQTMATLSFSPLTPSDAGNYTCRATVTSSLLSVPIISASNTSNLFVLACKIKFSNSINSVYYILSYL